MNALKWVPWMEEWRGNFGVRLWKYTQAVALSAGLLLLWTNLNMAEAQETKNEIAEWVCKSVDWNTEKCNDNITWIRIERIGEVLTGDQKFNWKNTKDLERLLAVIRKQFPKWESKITRYLETKIETEKLKADTERLKADTEKEKRIWDFLQSSL
jgi:hypothetical protein